MKAAALINGALVFALFSIIYGCNDRNETKPDAFNSKITNHSDCKLFSAANGRFTSPDTMSCIYYSYSLENRVLIIHHVNAGFNCCPDGFYCKTTLENDTITIREYEKDNGCDCLCLFDLDIELEGVNQGIYTMKFFEPYAEDKAQLIFFMDLISAAEGEYCITRKGYPWGE